MQDSIPDRVLAQSTVTHGQINRNRTGTVEEVPESTVAETVTLGGWMSDRDSSCGSQVEFVVLWREWDLVRAVEGWETQLQNNHVNRSKVFSSRRCTDWLQDG